MRIKTILKLGLLFIAATYAVYLLSLPITQNKFYQWDFKTYYYAGKAYASGLNPYGLTALSEVAKEPIRFRHRYPPISLWVCRFFALFDFKTASLIYLALKVLCLAGLFFIWYWFFLRQDDGIWLFIFSLLAFNSAVFVDILAGNISIFEQLGLWLAFVFLLRRKLFLFCLFVFLAAQFKLTPLFFLVLLLFIEDKRKYWFFTGTAAAFGLVQALSAVTSPFYKEFLAYGLEFENYMQSIYTLIGEILRRIGELAGFSVSTVLPKIIFGAIAATVLYSSWRAIRAFRSLPSIGAFEKDRLTIFLVCLTYALTVPRFLAYSHILLIPAAYFALKRLPVRSAGVFLFVLTVLYIPAGAAAPGMNVLLQLFWKYQTVLIAASLWGLGLYWIKQSQKSGLIAFSFPSPLD